MLCTIFVGKYVTAAKVNNIQFFGVSWDAYSNESSTVGLLNLRQTTASSQTCTLLFLGVSGGVGGGGRRYLNHFSFSRATGIAVGLSFSTGSLARLARVALTHARHRSLEEERCAFSSVCSTLTRVAASLCIECVTYHSAKW